MAGVTKQRKWLVWAIFSVAAVVWGVVILLILAEVFGEVASTPPEVASTPPCTQVEQEYVELVDKQISLASFRVGTAETELFRFIGEPELILDDEWLDSYTERLRDINSDAATFMTTRVPNRFRTQHRSFQTAMFDARRFVKQIEPQLSDVRNFDEVDVDEWKEVGILLARADNSLWAASIGIRKLCNEK